MYLPDAELALTGVEELNVFRELNRYVSVLLVEDNPADVTMFKLGLEETRARCRLEIATDGKQAIDLLLHAVKGSVSADVMRPDLILLDLNIPKIGGHEVLRIIRADPRFQSIPVVILTSSRSRSDVVTAYSDGANSYLQKPQTLEDFLDMMRTIEHYWLDLALLPSSGCQIASTC